MKYRFLRFPGSKAKALTFSFDDADISDKKVIEILKKYDMKATFNIHGWNFRREELGLAPGLTKEELLTIYDSNGHEVAIHGYDHLALINGSTTDGIKDILFGRTEIERFYGRIIRGYAYADRCATTPEIKSYLRMLDIAYARSAGVENDTFKLPEDWLCWMPTCSHISPNLMDYAETFINTNPRKKYYASADPMLFFVWGHPSELRDDKWYILEDFCEKMSTDDDIWYATSMELYEYINAYRSLIFNVDNTLVMNPTLHTVYFDTEKHSYTAKPGETITIE